METSIHNVRDLQESERSAVERIVGHALAEDQQLVIVVRYSPAKSPAQEQDAPVPQLPEWCNVYKGLSDDEVSDLEDVVLTRADLSRPTE